MLTATGTDSKIVEFLNQYKFKVEPDTVLAYEPRAVEIPQPPVDPAPPPMQDVDPLLEEAPIPLPAGGEFGHSGSTGSGYRGARSHQGHRHPRLVQHADRPAADERAH